jgi:hypothetical protein
MAQRIQFTNKSISHFAPDSAEKAYTLGFLWGDAAIKSYKLVDGTISNNHYAELEIVRSDLDNIKDVFSVWGNWQCRYRKRAGRREQGTIILCDGNFGWFLVMNDYMIKSKSEPTKILSTIPNQYKSYWWRGFIDADGCFYHKGRAKQFSIAGPFGISWQETINLFQELNIENYQVQQRVHKKSKSSAIRLSKKDSIVKLGNYIYSDKLTIGLQRKYDKFMQIKL